MTAMREFWMIIYNLPRGTSWQELKDFAAKGDKGKINIAYVDIFPESRTGILWFNEQADWQQEYDFLKTEKYWKDCRLQVERGKLREDPPASSGRRQGTVMYQTSHEFQYVRHAPSSFLTDEFHETMPPIASAHENPLLPVTYSLPTSPAYSPPSSEYESREPLSVTAIPIQTMFVGAPATPGYLTEPRGVHIGNLPSETSEIIFRHFIVQTIRIGHDQILKLNLPTNSLGKQKGYALVSFKTRDMAIFAKTTLDGITFRGKLLKVKIDQDWQTLFPSSDSANHYDSTQSCYQRQPQYDTTNSAQSGSWGSGYSTSPATYHGQGIAESTEQASETNLAPKFIEPRVVNGSRTA